MKSRFQSNIKYAFLFTVIILGATFIFQKTSTRKETQTITTHSPTSEEFISGIYTLVSFMPPAPFLPPEPGVHKNVIHIPSKFRNDAYLVTGGWCARSQQTLEENLESITFELFINEVQTPTDHLYQSDAHTYTGYYCRYWQTISTGWDQDMIVPIEKRYTLLEDINNGDSFYVSGEYVRILEVKTDW